MKQKNKKLIGVVLIFALLYALFRREDIIQMLFTYDHGIEDRWGDDMPSWRSRGPDDDSDDDWPDDDYKRKQKKLDEERSAERKALAETIELWHRGPSYERQHPNVEGAHMTRWRDEIAEETGEPRFVGTTRIPFPDTINRMRDNEKYKMVVNELNRLQTLQLQIKDNLDLWVKNGSDPHQQIMSPMSGWWANPKQVEKENHEILLEIDRLERMRDELWELLGRRRRVDVSYSQDPGVLEWKKQNIRRWRRDYWMSH